MPELQPGSDSDFDLAEGEDAEDLSDFDPAIDEWAAVDPPAAVLSAGSSELGSDISRPSASAAGIAAALPAAPVTAAAPVAHTTHNVRAAAAPQAPVPKPQQAPAPATAAAGALTASEPAAVQAAKAIPAADALAIAATAASQPGPQPLAAAPTPPAPRQSSLADHTSTAKPAPSSSTVGTPNTSTSINSPVTAPASGRTATATNEPSDAGSSRAAGGGWGLGGGWGFSALSSKLQQVAAGAVADARELGETFTKVMADITADEDDEVEQLAAYQAPHDPSPAAVPLEQGTSAVPPPTLVTSREESRHGGTAAVGGLQGVEAGGQLEQERRRQEVLRRLEGEPVQLEAGLKVIDDRVEQLATGAVKAIGSLWGGLASLSSKVEAATFVLAKELADTFEEGVTTVSRQAEKGLETVSRGALGLLDPAAASSSSSRRRSDSATQDALSFDRAFYVYGGRQAHEELEALSNECARIANKARSKLETAARAQLDDALQQLAPYFDLDAPVDPQPGPPATPGTAATGGTPAPLAGDVEPGTNATDGQQGLIGALSGQHVSDAVQEALETQYAPMAALLKGAVKRADELAAAAPSAAVQAAAASTSGGQVAGGQQGGAEPVASSPGQQRTAAGGAGVAEPEIQAEGEGQAAEEQQRQQGGPAGGSAAALAAWLHDVQAAAVKALAALASGQQMMLLNLGRSIASPARYGKSLDDGITWPTSGTAIAVILRAQAATMVSDLQAAAAAFMRLLPVLAALLAQQPPAAQLSAQQLLAQQPKGQEGRQQQQQTGQEVQQQGEQASVAGGSSLPEQLAAALEGHTAMAVARVREGFRALLYVVLLASVHRDGAQQQAKQQPHEVQERGQQGVNDNDVAAPLLVPGSGV